MHAENRGGGLDSEPFLLRQSAGSGPYVLKSYSKTTQIILEANPLEDINNTRRINAVYLRGQAVDHPDRLAGGRFYRAYVVWLTIPPISMLFLGQPVYLLLPDVVGVHLHGVH